MSLAQAEKTPAAPTPAGGVHFVAATRHTDLCAELRARRYLVAPVSAPERGRLRHAIDDAVEGALAMRGALPPAVELDAMLEPTLRDQVFRARALGATGLAVTLPRLGDAEGALLDAADGAALSTWLSAARRAPLLIVLDEHDRGARVLAPVPIGDLAGASPLASRDSVPPSGEVETRAAPGAEPPAGFGAESGSYPGPPPPVLTIPRRGVMKKRSQRVEAPPVAEETPAPPAVRPQAIEPSQRPDPSVLRSVAALMAPVPQLDPGPAGLTPPPHAVVDLPFEDRSSSRRPLRFARARPVAPWTPPSGGSTPSISTRPAGPSRVKAPSSRLFAVRYMPPARRGGAGRGRTRRCAGWSTALAPELEHSSYREAFRGAAGDRRRSGRPWSSTRPRSPRARVARLNGARAAKLPPGRRDALRRGRATRGRAAQGQARRPRRLWWSALLLYGRRCPPPRRRSSPSWRAAPTACATASPPRRARSRRSCAGARWARCAGTAWARREVMKARPGGGPPAQRRTGLRRPHPSRSPTRWRPSS